MDHKQACKKRTQRFRDFHNRNNLQCICK
ncbi:hypothetical protein F383_24514 [Gossypium arboreum]|uniref:Uncharacterized protein n=1 Tax=Gossypium arboreum TaxID=29729 RepID=A0A0B0P4V0_GOSAR|nr:hypothetical protein F383_24514 [Gossypium arboreum]